MVLHLICGFYNSSKKCWILLSFFIVYVTYLQVSFCKQLLLKIVNFLIKDTGFPLKDETVKTTQNSKNMTIWRLILGFCNQLSNFMVYWMIKHWNKPVLVYKEPYMQENGLNKFRTIVFEISSFVGNPVYESSLIGKWFKRFNPHKFH